MLNANSFLKQLRVPSVTRNTCNGYSKVQLASCVNFKGVNHGQAVFCLLGKEINF